MMTASIDYNGALRCTAIHLQSNTKIETDAPTDNCGQGARFSPTDLTATSLGLCLITTMAIKAQGKDIELAGSRVEVLKRMSAEPPRRIVGVDLQVLLKAPGISEEDRLWLEDIGRHCPVARSLHPDIEQRIEFTWHS